MDVYSWVSLATVIITVLAVWKIRKRKEYQYSMLDTSGIILNVVLVVMIYPPLSVVCGLLGLYQEATEPFAVFLEDTAIALGRLMPAISVAGIGFVPPFCDKETDKIAQVFVHRKLRIRYMCVVPVFMNDIIPIPLTLGNGQS